ncbi:uncharacterized protein A4U43_C07F19620 [Asparagus officinalis]|uniref:Uncharacterized protein n=1 Tax=Asparagus officinalis TaxID=4686 RepID=A0A5P1EDG1_ASPOF|nr:uncharacterized protein A4U43_C07F19620 [Asparagus officinalis]
MAFGSLSLISSSSNPIPNPSPSPSSAFHGAQRPPRSLPFRALRRPRAISASIEERDDGIDQFSESNSISDFMRFKKGEGVGRGGEGTGELQTAVVSYKKRFPWVLLQPFLQLLREVTFSVSPLYHCLEPPFVTAVKPMSPS